MLPMVREAADGDPDVDPDVVGMAGAPGELMDDAGESGKLIDEAGEPLDACIDDGSASSDHRRGPRRRGDALTAAIFDATLTELADVGYAELTMERVASRARASKGSLYRRWSNRAELVVDAMHHARPHYIEPPDTGRVRDDLLGYLRAVADLLNGADGEAARGLMVESVRDPELMAVVRIRFIDPGIAMVLDVLRRGAVRGEVRPTALTHRIASVGPGLIRQQYMVYGAPIPDDVVLELVDEVLMPLIST
jgi:AcrR family transcriptional regulator